MNLKKGDDLIHMIRTAKPIRGSVSVCQSSQLLMGLAVHIYIYQLLDHVVDLHVPDCNDQSLRNILLFRKLVK